MRDRQGPVLILQRRDNVSGQQRRRLSLKIHVIGSHLHWIQRLRAALRGRDCVLNESRGLWEPHPCGGPGSEVTACLLKPWNPLFCRNQLSERDRNYKEIQHIPEFTAVSQIKRLKMCNICVHQGQKWTSQQGLFSFVWIDLHFFPL